MDTLQSLIQAGRLENPFNSGKCFENRRKSIEKADFNQFIQSFLSVQIPYMFQTIEKTHQCQ